MGKKSQSQEPNRQAAIKCSICMQTTARAEVGCSHKFCMRCITRWTKKIQTCPLCRRNIREIKYGNRVKVVEQTRRPGRVTNAPTPNVRQVRMRIQWKPLIFIGLPYFNYFMTGPRMPAPILF